VFVPTAMFGGTGAIVVDGVETGALPDSPGKEIQICIPKSWLMFEQSLLRFAFQETICEIEKALLLACVIP